jgi:hypothetical protein
MTRNFITIILIIIGSLLLAACGGGATPDVAATEVPIAIADTSIVAEGRVGPRDSVELSFLASGQIDELLVKEGDTVQIGDVLARLGDREQIESQLAAAQAELTAARQEQNAAEQALETIYDDLPTAQSQALEELKNARKEQDDAQRSYNSLNSWPMRLTWTLPRPRWCWRGSPDQAMEDFEPYENKPEDNLARDVPDQADCAERLRPAVNGSTGWKGWWAATSTSPEARPG